MYPPPPPPTNYNPPPMYYQNNFGPQNSYAPNPYPNLSQPVTPEAYQTPQSHVAYPQINSNINPYVTHTDSSIAAISTKNNK